MQKKKKKKENTCEIVITIRTLVSKKGECARRSKRKILVLISCSEFKRRKKKGGKRGRFFLAVVVGFHCSAWKPKSVFFLFVCLFVCLFFLVLGHCFYNMQLLFVLSSLCFSSFLLRYRPRCVWACWKLKLVRHGVVDGWHYPTRCNFLQLFLFFFCCCSSSSSFSVATFQK